ncbi:CDP-alcohol phosphatidyltransferase family protein [Candidatus Dojkabacteria bacterium]|jgi:phosphatidylglycerophosphate synthase|nr:CDP-alcohol phosphatidyltransferase family protein [Candidatus Dojkabacteria bacterium]
MKKQKKDFKNSELFSLLQEGKVQEFFDELGKIIETFGADLKNFNLDDWAVKYSRGREQQAINTAITGKAEEKAKEWICPRIPEWINSDHLTVLGYIGMIITALGFVLGFMNRWYILLIPFGLFVNWFGDSFDGSIARYRKKTRPKYGYYIDKIVDAIAVITLALGIGLSGFFKIEIALLFACVYLALMSHVDLVTHVQGQNRNAFGLFGPTEIRIVGVLFSIYMFFSKVHYFNVYGYIATQYDIVLFAITVIMAGVLFVSIIKKGIELHKIDTKNW